MVVSISATVLPQWVLLSTQTSVAVKDGRSPECQSTHLAYFTESGQTRKNVSVMSTNTTICSINLRVIDACVTYHNNKLNR